MFSRTLFIMVLLLCPLVAFGSVESSLLGLQSVLIERILPIFAVLGLGFAGFGFFTGNPNAKQNFIYALSGAVIVFGAQSIVDLIRRVVQ